jgi:hypothetical protein
MGVSQMFKNGCNLTLSLLLVLVATTVLGCKSPGGGNDGPTNYERIYIQLLDPDNYFSYVPIETDMSLHGSGTELPILDSYTSAGSTWGWMDYSATMRSGDTFIIKIVCVEPGIPPGSFPAHPDPGSYAIRVVALAAADPSPSTMVSPGISGINDGNEPDDALDPWSGDPVASLGLNQIVARTFTGTGDIDFFRLVLP